MLYYIIIIKQMCKFDSDVTLFDTCEYQMDPQMLLPSVCQEGSSSTRRQIFRHNNGVVK